MESKYLKQFNKLAKEGKELFTLKGNTVLIEILEEEEIKTSSGLIIAKSLDQRQHGVHNARPTIGIVVLCGEGYIDDMGESEELPYKPGAVVLVPSYASQQFQVFPGIEGVAERKLGFVSDNDIRFFYKDIAAFTAAKELMKEV